MRYLDFEEVELQRLSAYWTAREISQQPLVWGNTVDTLRDSARELEAFMAPLLLRTDLRVILTGAGSSAYIGRCLQPALLQRLARRVEAIPTTDIVAGPLQVLQPDVPTLLVSFGRSGSSPESLAAVALTERHVKECYHLIVTCNPHGELFRRCAGQRRSFALLLPEATHDRGFAMTSSFTAMALAAMGAFVRGAANSPVAARIHAAGPYVLKDLTAPLRVFAAQSFTRVVFLGSRGLAGLAKEAAHKLLELTDGEVASIANSPLGIRHGPKTFVNRETLVVVFVSNDALARRYDFDLLRELCLERVAGKVLAITGRPLDAAPSSARAPPLEAIACDSLLIPGMQGSDDFELLFPFAMCAQIFAFYRALQLRKAPDNPSASGTVNRVVKGVTIHAA